MARHRAPTDGHGHTVRRLRHRAHFEAGGTAVRGWGRGKRQRVFRGPDGPGYGPTARKRQPHEGRRPALAPLCLGGWRQGGPDSMGTPARPPGGMLARHTPHTETDRLVTELRYARAEFR
ncbi:hypothetical protein ACWCV9_01005 [Streptomyces sp. NPDC001606]